MINFLTQPTFIDPAYAQCLRTLRLVKNGIIPLAQIIIMLAILISIIYDLYKKKYKKEKLPKHSILKKILWIIYVYLVPWIINIIFFTILTPTEYPLESPPYPDYYNFKFDNLWPACAIITSLMLPVIYYSKKKLLTFLIVVLVIVAIYILTINACPY